MLDRVIGIDIGGTNIRMAEVDSKFNLFNEEMTSSKALTVNPIDTLADIINKYIEKNNSKADYISIGLPSTIDKSRKRELFGLILDWC